MSSMSGQHWTIAAGAHEVSVAEVGAGLQRYTADAVDVTVPYGDDELPPKGCGMTLVPWPNRIRDGRYTFDGEEQQLGLSEPDKHNAIHGLGRWERWAPVVQDADRVTLALDVVPQKGYPHQVRAEVTYALDDVAGLTVTLHARNEGSTRAPFGAGSHPYLGTHGHVLDDVTLHLPAGEVFDVDDRLIPIGRHPVGPADDWHTARVLGQQRLNGAYTAIDRTDGRGQAAVRTPTGGAVLWFDEAFGYVQTYTVDEMAPGVAGVAIEPMSCPADAFNSGTGLVVLEPGAEWTGHWGITPD